MKERINKLAEQCTVSFVDGRGVELNEIDVEVFAKLIVKECTDFLKDVLDDYFAAEQLEEHFGELR